MKFSMMLVITTLMMAFSTGCASIIHGTSQKIPIESNPPGAVVFVDGEIRGRTPLSIRLRRREANNEVTLELEGYEPMTKTIGRRFSWWYAGNVIFGGLIGICVDAADGAMWYRDCNGISVTMSPIPSEDVEAASLSEAITPTPSEPVSVPEKMHPPMMDGNPCLEEISESKSAQNQSQPPIAHAWEAAGGLPRLRNAIISEEPSISAASI